MGAPSVQSISEGMAERLYAVIVYAVYRTVITNLSQLLPIQAPWLS